MRAEGLRGVDVWLGFPGTEHIRQVTSVLRPKVFVPHHWDDFWEPMLRGLKAPLSPAAVERLATAGVRVVVPRNYFDQLRVDTAGVTAAGDDGVRARLGVPDPSP